MSANTSVDEHTPSRHATRSAAPLLAQRLGLLTVAFIGYAVPGQFIIWLNGGGFWPSAGVGVGLLVLTPVRLWPWALSGVALAEAGGSWWAGYPISGIPLWTLANVSEQAFGAFLFRRFTHGGHRLLPVRHVLIFVACCVVGGPALGATVGTISSVLTQNFGWTEAWLRWFAGDALGVLVVAPIILTWREASLRPLTLEWWVIAAGLLATSIAGVLHWPGTLELLSPYFAMPFLTWAALRFGIRHSAWLVFVLAQIVNASTAHNSGAFAEIAGNPAQAVMLLQVFLAITSCATFVLAATAHELSDKEQVERVLQELADSMPQLVWVADERGRVKYFNPRSARYLAPEAEVPSRWQSLVAASDVATAAADWERVLAVGRRFEQEHRLQMSDGALRWHLTRAERVESSSGVRWYGTSTDIDDLKRLGEVKDEFIALASHELRNPVAAVHGLAQLLQRRLRRNLLTLDDTRPFADELVQHTAHLARLTTELMDVSRMQRGAPLVHLESVDLTALLADIARSPTWPGTRIEVRAMPRLHAQADPSALRQVLSNLLDNAIKYSPATEGVDVRASSSEGGVLVEVTDRGIGIAEDDRDAIFEPFARGANSGHVAGLGLGLYVSRELVRVQEGRLWAESAGPAGGTSMKLWLPAAAAHENSSSPSRSWHDDDRAAHDALEVAGALESAPA